MGWLRRIRPNSRAIVVAGAITAVTAIAAFVFADSSQAERVATQGQIAEGANDVIATAATLKSNLGITVVLADAAASGVHVVDPVARAVGGVELNVDELARKAAALDSLAGTSLARRVTDIAGAVEAVTQAIDEGSRGAADTLASERAVPEINALVAEAVQLDASASARIAAERETAGRAASTASLIVALLVPAVVVTTVWTSARRRIDRVALKAEIDKHRALEASRDALIAGISHELRTPLTGILGFSETLLGRLDDRPLVHEGLRAIHLEATQLSRMIDDLLVMARLDGGSIEIRLAPVDAAAEIHTVAATFMTAERKIDLDITTASVMVDRLRLRHVLRNLVSNAIEHGGPAVIIKGGPLESVYRVVVADNGAGLDPTHPMFEPYAHPTDETVVTGSLGLGLAVSKRLADAMGCRLSYRRMDGLTLFVVDLPLIESGRPLAPPLVTNALKA